MKKILALAATALLLISTVSCASSGGSNLSSINDYVAPDYTVSIATGTLTFEEGQGDTAIITKYSGVYTDHALIIPNTVQGRTVVGIADEAFYYCTAITSVTIPETVTSIGSYAFAGCDRLAEVNIPAAVTEIGEAAFIGCTSLKTVTFGADSELKTIGDHAFYNCTALSDITLPAALETVGVGSFWGCESISKVVIPDSVKTIGKMAYYFCTGLNTEGCVELTASIEKIGDFAFATTNKDYIIAPEGSYAKEFVDNMPEYVEPETEAATFETEE